MGVGKYNKFEREIVRKIKLIDLRMWRLRRKYQNYDMTRRSLIQELHGKYKTKVRP